MSRYLVTGATGGSATSTTANRLEIHDFIKQEEQFSLYIQALQFIYTSKSQNEIDSFFQIGGIHGLPYISWDGAGSKPVDPDAWEGYCTHGNVLFPTFHRPYVMLVEQSIQAAAIKIAATYTVNKARYQDAALNLRQPYWDWALNSVPPPEVISLDKVTIVNPSGQKVSVTNPLRRYTFHPIDPSFPEPYHSWSTTVRYPTSSRPNPPENISQLTKTLKSAGPQLKSKTYNLLTRVHTWPAFSNHTPGDGGSASNSLEGIHDSVHVDVGGNGQMSDPSVAAFDPIFWLHHAQVDRLLSLWSALNPGVWVTNGPSGDGTWSIPAGETVGAKTNLAPFWNTQTSYWASDDVTNTTGYTYPEFNGLNLSNPAAVKAAIAQKVNQLYGGTSSIFSSFAATAPQSSGSKPAPVAVAAATATSAAAQVSSDRGIQGSGNAAPQVTIASVEPESSEPSELWEWSARVHVKKYEIGGSFKVLFFLGSVPSDPGEWSSANHFVGAFHGFVNTSAGRCANCRTQQDAFLEGFVHLNDGISRLSNLNSFEPAVVKPYLTSNLHWRVQKTSGEVVDISTVPSLEVTVTANHLTLPPGAHFPVPGRTHHHHGITHGRPGGSSHTDAETVDAA